MPSCKLCKTKSNIIEDGIQLQFKINIVVIAEVKNSELQSMDYAIKVLIEEGKTLTSKLNVI